MNQIVLLLTLKMSSCILGRLLLDGVALEAGQIVNKQFPRKMIHLVEERSRSVALRFVFVSLSRNVLSSNLDPLRPGNMSVDSRKTQAAFFSVLQSLLIYDARVNQHIAFPLVLNYSDSLEDSNLRSSESYAVMCPHCREKIHDEFRKLFVKDCNLFRFLLEEGIRVLQNLKASANNFIVIRQNNSLSIMKLGMTKILTHSARIKPDMC